MTYSGGRDIAMQMVEACNDFVLSAVRIAWDGGFYCHEFHGDVEMLFDRLATLWDEYWKKWAEAAEKAVANWPEAKKKTSDALFHHTATQEERDRIRKNLKEMARIEARLMDMTKEGISPAAQIILDRWLEDRRQRYGEEET